MPQKINLIFRLTGEAVDQGIDVFELSPLLMSIGTLIQDGQSLVHPEGKKLGVNIKPFEQGSFIIELSIFAQNNLQQVLDLTNNSSVQEVKELIEWLGIIGSSGWGVLKIYKWLQGKPKKFEEVNENEVKIVNKEGNSITVNKNVFSLFQNTSIQQNIYHIYGNFLGKEGISSVESYEPHSENAEKVIINKEDVSLFNPENTVPSETEDESESRNITRVYLKPKRISVEGEPNNWSLRKGEGIVITANIKDEEFLEKIRSGEIRLSSEDLLLVDLLEIQTVKDNDVSVKYEVNRVIEYKRAPIQTSLLDHQ